MVSNIIALFLYFSKKSLCTYYIKFLFYFQVNFPIKCITSNLICLLKVLKTLSDKNKTEHTLETYRLHWPVAR